MKKISSLILVISLLISSFAGIDLGTVCVAESQPLFSKEFLAPIEESDASAEKIYTADDLVKMQDNLQGSYVLMQDIDLSGKENWAPIGKTKSSPFCGKLDGQGHKITGLTVNISINSASLNSPAHAAGLFGVCCGAIIKNLELKDVDIKITNSSGYIYEGSKIDGTNIYAGGIGGYLYNDTSVYNCHVSGNIVASTSQEAHNAYAGGIAGYMASTIVSYSENHAAVKASAANAYSSSDAYAGGVAGVSLVHGYIDHYSNSGEILATTKDYGKAYCGGFLGIGSGDAERFEISDSYNEGEVTATAGNAFCESSYAGGIAGKYINTINRVYNSGNVCAKATSYIEGTAYAGGICATSTSDTVIKNSASIQERITASGIQSHKYYISQGNAVKENNVALLSLSGGTNDATYRIDENELKNKSIYENQLSWDFNTVWKMISGKDYPVLKEVDTESEEYQKKYIEQHQAFINGNEYNNIVKNYRWAQIYWSEENNFKSNAAGALYTTLDTTVKVLSLNFKDLFDDDNPYKIILADYVSDQVVEEEVMQMYQAELPFKLEKIYNEAKKFIKKHWKDSFGELSDEDIFYLFHYNKKPSYQWINENFQEHLAEIVYETKESGKGFETVIGASAEAFEELLKLENQYNSFASFVNNLMQYSANVSAYCTASENFKKILKRMENNIGDSQAEHKLLLKSALASYTIYNDDKNTAGKMILQYMKDKCLEDITSKIKESFNNYVVSWIKSVLSEKAMSALNKIGWAAKVGWNIAEYITKNGDLQNCRDMLRANASLELVMYDTLTEIKNEFILNATYDNACMFDAAFRFFKETQIYSMNICMKYLDIYQTSWVAAIKHLSTSSNVSAIEQVIFNKLFLYKIYCHGVTYDMGMKLVRVACPTDVYIYDSESNEIASVVNEEVKTDSTDIVVFASGKEKWIALPKEQEYFIKIIAIDDGEMEYSITEYNSELQREGIILYSDIALSKNQTFDGEIPAGHLNSSIQEYKLTDSFGNVYMNCQEITSDSYIKATDISVDTTKINIQEGEKYAVQAAILPQNASYQNLTWYSSDEKIATVSENGTIRGVSKGSCEITVCSINENIAKFVVVSVGEKSPVKPTIPEPSHSPSPRPSITPVTSPAASPSIIPTQEPRPDITPTIRPDDVPVMSSPTVPTTPQPSPTKSANPSGGSGFDNGSIVVTPVKTPVPILQPPTVLPTAEPLIPSVIPSKKPEPTSVVIPTVQPTERPSEILPSTTEEPLHNTSTSLRVAINTIFKDRKSGGTYRITAIGGNPTVEYIGFEKNVAKVKIPTVVKYSGKEFKVMSIGNKAFYKNRKLEKVVFGKNIKKIGNKAFYDCINLRSLKLNAKLTLIGNSAFGKCSMLKLLTLPKNVKRIGRKAFSNCKRLRYVMVKTTKLQKETFGKDAFSKGYSKPRVKTSKRVWRNYSNIFVVKGKMSENAVFVINPVKLVI